eukprot:CAMPEP_0174229814 /NCGR_PEP_ID=MMETSP0417-20130205/697_1 /TAXON_ID=242541 /ORGANISM="Mayorella sp, Strain BSH-02190019" /LENGTH=349 /DNA_ID=CAMNT_0015307403 /DNA_START=172 /DNA_END=1221 /DNA_ORIENTATION=-
MPAPFIIWSTLPQRFDTTLDQDPAVYVAASPAELYANAISADSILDEDSFMTASVADISLLTSKRVEESVRASLGLTPLRFDGATPLFQAASPDLAKDQLVVLFLASRMTSVDLRQQVAIGQFDAIRQAVQSVEHSRSFDNIDGGLSNAQLSVLIGDLLDERADQTAAVLLPSAPEGVDFSVDLLLSSLPSDPRLQTLSDVSQLESSVASAALLLVPLDSRPAEAQKTAQRVVESLRSSSRVHVSMYTALGSVPEPQARFGVDRDTLHRELLSLRATAEPATQNNTSYNPYCSGDTCTTRFPPAFWEGFIVTVILLIILFVGVCCTCYVQTPDKFASFVKHTNKDEFSD